MADGLSCREVPNTQHLLIHREVLAEPVSIYQITELVLNEAHLSLLEMEGCGQRHCEDKKEVSEVC